jgi:hypothetical protein
MDAGDVAAEGRALASDGVQCVIDGIIPAYGMLGINVASAKLGKTTLGHALGAAVATGTPFLNRSVTQARVLVIAAEDPPEYTAYLARHLTVPAGAMTIYRRPLRFDAAGLTAITTTPPRAATASCSCRHSSPSLWPRDHENAPTPCAGTGAPPRPRAPRSASTKRACCTTGRVWMPSRSRSARPAPRGESTGRAGAWCSRRSVGGRAWT